MDPLDVGLSSQIETNKTKSETKESKEIMANTVRKQATKPVDLIALAGDASGAWETQVFCGTVVSTSRDGTFISFGAQKDGLLRNKWSYQGVHRQTGKPQEIELRVNAKIRVMITNIKLAKKLRDTRVGLRVAPQCRCCRAFGHYESACKARKDRVSLVCETCGTTGLPALSFARQGDNGPWHCRNCWDIYDVEFPPVM